MNISLRRLVLMAGFFLMSTSLIWAQSSQLSGRILGPNDEPLIGANIIVVGTILGTTTDLDGNFSFTGGK